MYIYIYIYIYVLHVRIVSLPLSLYLQICICMQIAHGVQCCWVVLVRLYVWVRLSSDCRIAALRVVEDSGLGLWDMRIGLSSFNSLVPQLLGVVGFSSEVSF